MRPAASGLLATICINKITLPYPWAVPTPPVPAVFFLAECTSHACVLGQVYAYRKRTLLPDHLIGSGAVKIEKPNCGQTATVELQDKGSVTVGIVEFRIAGDSDDSTDANTGSTAGAGAGAATGRSGAGTGAAAGAGIGAAAGATTGASTRTGSHPPFPQAPVYPFDVLGP